MMIALIVALFGFFPHYETAFVVSVSMQPTLVEGDVVLVDRFAYGLPVLPQAKTLSVFLPRLNSIRARRGDVVMLRPPNGSDAQIVKRIVALPGERFAVKNGRIFINGQAVAQTQAGSLTFEGKTQTLWRETSAEGRSYRIALSEKTRKIGDFAERQVPQDHYAVLGDNRAQSLDSRSEIIGFVPHKRLLGRVEARLFSLDTAVWPLSPAQWPFVLRSGRAFQMPDTAN